MLDTIKIGLLRLDFKGNKPHGYLRITLKSGEVKSYFRIPLHVAFDLVGYNTYKKYLKKEDPEFRTWIHDISIMIPPNLEHCRHYALESGHEWFLGNLRDLAQNYSNFPYSLNCYVQDSIRQYLHAKKKTTQSSVPDDYPEPSPMNKAQIIAAERAIKIYGQLQRSRFDPGRPQHQGEFAIAPFCRNPGEKPAKAVIEKVTEAVANYIFETPKISKYSETEGGGLRIKLTAMFMECFYKEQIRFMQKKLEQTK